jgi:hypothetical protein
MNSYIISFEILILMSSLVSLALLSVLSVTFGWQQVICSVALDRDRLSLHYSTFLPITHGLILKDESRKDDDFQNFKL